MPRRSYHVRWVRALRRRLIREFGGRCSNPNCKDPKRSLEFAHVHGAPRRLNGRSRGSQRRAYDVKRYSHDYVLLCKRCHFRYDCEGSL